MNGFQRPMNLGLNLCLPFSSCVNLGKSLNIRILNFILSKNMVTKAPMLCRCGDELRGP